MTGQEAVALAQPSAGVVAGFLILAVFVGTGGLVAIVVTARVAHRTLEPAQRVALFRGLGRVYGPVGGAALAGAFGCGPALVADRAWSGALITAVVIASCLVAVTGTGVAQARRMTRLRRTALAHPADPLVARMVRRGALRAAALRGAIAALTLALIAVAVLLML